MYYRGAAAAVVVYDITHPASFERAKKWVHELRQNVPNSALIIALVGNKCDLGDQRAVPEAEAAAYSQEAGLLQYETSAKTNVNVLNVFEDIADRLPRTAPAPPPVPAIQLGETPQQRRRGACCS